MDAGAGGAPALRPFLWTLYWCNRDQRFRRYSELEPTTDVGVLLDEIERDPHCVFWG